MSDATQGELPHGIDPSQMPNSSIRTLHGGELDGARVQVLDLREVALMVVVGRDGMATAQATIPKATAADALEQIAKMWRAEAEAEIHADRAERRSSDD